MDKVVIKKYPKRYWSVAEIYRNCTYLATVNKFYEVTPDFIIIYETVGGSGTGFKKGNVEQKIYIGDCELSQSINED